MRLGFMRYVLTLVGVSSLAALSSAPAHAERVISDLEASKLTFASLTAAPPVIPVRHTVRIARNGHHTTMVAHAKPAHGMVRLVSYHAKHAAPHAIKRHRT